MPDSLHLAFWNVENLFDTEFAQLALRIGIMYGEQTA